METDNGKRGASGVVVSLVDIEPGKLRLVFDDVKNQSLSDCGSWTHHVLFTFKDYNADDIIDHKISDRELADIGYNLLARLGALYKHPIN